MPLAPDSLERLVPDALEPGDATGRATLRLHLERYEFAARCLAPGRVLDIACGVGYGTRLLADRGAAVRGVLGVDRSDAAVAYAQTRYGGAGVAFQVADAFAFRDAEGFDSIVSLETIEHLEDPGRFLAGLAAMLRPGGVLIASVPTTPSVDVNPHHRHDFNERGFRRMLAALGLTPFDALRQVQPVPLGAVLRRSEARMSDLRPHLLGVLRAPPGIRAAPALVDAAPRAREPLPHARRAQGLAGGSRAHGGAPVTAWLGLATPGWPRDWRPCRSSRGAGRPRTSPPRFRSSRSRERGRPSAHSSSGM